MELTGYCKVTPEGLKHLFVLDGGGTCTCGRKALGFADEAGEDSFRDLPEEDAQPLLMLYARHSVPFAPLKWTAETMLARGAVVIRHAELTVTTTRQQRKRLDGALVRWNAQLTRGQSAIRRSRSLRRQASAIRRGRLRAVS